MPINYVAARSVIRQVTFVSMFSIVLMFEYNIVKPAYNGRARDPILSVPGRIPLI
jgi:hypothetical protein